MASYNPGTYEGTGRGYGGKLIVNVTVSENKIESVKVTQHKEYRGIAWGLNTTPMERFPKLIVEYQTLNIPTVDGADLTCTAILDATAAALKAAGASRRTLPRSRPLPPRRRRNIRTKCARSTWSCAVRAQAAWPQPLRRSWPVRTSSSSKAGHHRRRHREKRRQTPRCRNQMAEKAGPV